MTCPHCRQGKLVLHPTCGGVEVGCPACGHIFSPEEVRELLAARREPRDAGSGRGQSTP